MRLNGSVCSLICLRVRPGLVPRILEACGSSATQFHCVRRGTKLHQRRYRLFSVLVACERPKADKQGLSLNSSNGSNGVNHDV